MRPTCVQFTRHIVGVVQLQGPSMVWLKEEALEKHGLQVLLATSSGELHKQLPCAQYFTQTVSALPHWLVYGGLIQHTSMIERMLKKIKQTLHERHGGEEYSSQRRTHVFIPRFIQFLNY